MLDRDPLTDIRNATIHQHRVDSGQPSDTLIVMLYRALLLVFCAASLALSAPFTSRYFSGDSLTDTGNIATASSF